jgi:hypothetical protein
MNKKQEKLIKLLKALEGKKITPQDFTKLILTEAIGEIDKLTEILKGLDTKLNNIDFDKQEKIIGSLKNIKDEITKVNSKKIDLSGIEKQLAEINKKMPKGIDVNKLGEIVSILKKIDTKSEFSIKEPTWLEKINPSKHIKALGDRIIKQLANEIVKVNVQNDWVPVKILDAKGNVIERFVPPNPAGAGGGKAGPDPVGLKNIADVKINPATEDKQDDIITRLSDVQAPIPVDGDSVYAKDVDTVNSDIGDFSGAISDLFDDRTSTVTTSVDNPSLTVALERPISNKAITIITSSGDFSNVTIVAKNAAGTVLETIDDSANNTKYTSHTYYFTDIDKWCVLDISFTTTDDVTLSFLDIYKSVHVDAHLHALKPDGTVTAIDATAGGNLKVSIEESDPAATLVTTPASSIIDSGNSTTTPLGIDGVYTGTAFDCEGYSSITNTIYADEDSATDGMQYQFCSDDSFGANTDTHSFTLDFSDSPVRRFQFSVTARYFRIKYTNGGTAQGAFDVQNIAHRTNVLTSIHRLGNDTTLDRSAQLVKALIMGETTAGGGGTVNVKVNPSGTLEVNEENSAAILTALQIMDDWDDADRAKISNRLIKSAIDDTTVDSTADLIFDASGDTDAVELTITNCHTTEVYVGEDSSVSTTDFMYYIPPKQTIVINHAGNSGTTEDLYGIRDTGDSGLIKVYSRKYKT